MKPHICPRCKNLLYAPRNGKPCPYCDCDIRRFDRTTRIWAVIAVLLVILALAVTAGVLG